MKIIVDISDARVSKDPGDELVTYSLGSCIGVTVHDPVSKIGGMLHYQLPSGRMDSDKANKNPLMFADTAMVLAKVGNYIEYSIAEQPYFVVNGKPDPTWYTSPSIHFRHTKKANIGFADGHVCAEKIGNYKGINVDGIKPSNFNIGWFEPINNSIFDLQ